MGLFGLVAVAMAGYASAQKAQPFSAADKVVLLQAKRFEGSFRLDSGETSVQVGEESADWKVKSGATDLSGKLAPIAGRSSRALLNVDGRTVEGTASIEGKALTMEFTDGKIVYRVRFLLSGRNDGEVNVTKGGATLVSGAFKRV